jgi:hypothetical protein
MILERRRALIMDGVDDTAKGIHVRSGQQLFIQSILRSWPQLLE